MILFYLKKNFCDGWDNMLSLIVPNVFIVSLVISFYFITGFVIEPLPLLGILVQIVGLCLVSTAIFAFGSGAAKLADFKTLSLKSYFAEFKNPAVWKDGALFGLMLGLIVILAILGIPFYLGLGNFIGIFFAALLFWLILIVVLSLQWFLPIRSLMNNNFAKCLKKSFLIFFDNPGFSIFVFIYSLVLLVLSLVLFFIIPGFSGILLAQTNALRLRLYKYDWYEEHPELTAKERKNVPWDELIAKDYDTLGPRSLKSFIFPWKY